MTKDEGKKEFEQFCIERGFEKNPAKKTLKKNLILGLIVLLVIGSSLTFLVHKTKTAQSQAIQEEVSSNAVVEDTNLTSADIDFNENESLHQDVVYNPVLQESIIDEIKNQMQLVDENLNYEDSGKAGRETLKDSEIFYLTDKDGNLMGINTSGLEYAYIDDGVIFNTSAITSSGTTKKKRTRKGSSRGDENSIIEDSVQNFTELRAAVFQDLDFDETSIKIIGKMYFPYGSSLDIQKSELVIEKYLLSAQTGRDKKEFGSAILTLNELVALIPEDKRENAKFILMGYADPTLFNGKIEISERSEKFNTELSKKRAESVKNILVSKDFNINPNHIVINGFGYSKNPNAKSDLGQYRRVDVLVSF